MVKPALAGMEKEASAHSLGELPSPGSRAICPSPSQALCSPAPGSLCVLLPSHPEMDKFLLLLLLLAVFPFVFFQGVGEALGRLGRGEGAAPGWRSDVAGRQRG